MNKNETLKWKMIAIELANYQALTVKTIIGLESISITEKLRQKRISNRIINLFRGDTLPHVELSFEVVIKKLAQAVKE